MKIAMDSGVTMVACHTQPVSDDKEVDVIAKLFLWAMTLTVMLFGGTAAAAQPAPRAKEAFADELSEIRQLSAGGHADITVLRLKALAKRLKADGVAPPKRCKVIKEALWLVLVSNVAKNDSVRAAAAQCALDAISETQREGITGAELLKPQLELALDVLPRTTASAECTAKMSLLLWGNLSVAVKHFSIYDPLHTDASVAVVPPVPPADFNEPFNFGAAPETIKHPVYRKQYEEYLRKRVAYGRGSCEYTQLRDMRQFFSRRLHGTLKAAYSTDPQKAKQGAAAIEKYVSDPAVRKELLNVIQSSSPSED